MVSVFFVGNSRCRGCFRPFLCNCMCFACKPRVLWAFVFYVRCCLVLQKFALATSKPFCKSCGYSRLKITAKRLFQNASSVKLQQKGTKKQPNVRLFGEFQHLPFTSDAVCFCKSLRWRLQKPFCKLCGYSRLKITAKRLFQNASSVKLQQKGTKKQPNVRLFGEFQHFPFTSDAVWFCKSLRWRLQKPFCKSCGYSRLKITAKHLFLG